ncbi:MAG: 1-(5-phosphoribosyl)-5-[(5-phosphoribosylamino)methylideneamino]imidazole-4-carboxamide isomerase [Planctomycetes bacterium]|nr:1-(5-phosphoribosyl)-5-[(5-phosphoribosylamino)methylideneamino]imidazole-4-carboxamide isomerase [Planctomycetota bacterium]
MYIIPAIDLLKGKCVRLVQGQYHRYINYEDNPVKKAKEFLEAGTQWLHIIDLDGAKVGRPVNTDAIKAIVAELTELKIEVGGGLRDRDSVRQLLDTGIERVIIGTKAVSDFDWFSNITQEFPGKITLSLDARGSKIATHGWLKNSHKSLFEFAIETAKLPLAAIIYTDITKDGMLAGPNFDKISTLAETVDVPVIAAGGITTIDDVRRLAQSKTVAAAIIGRALYEKTIDLSEAIQAVETPL